MAIKKGNAPKTIPAKLELTGGGEENTLSLTFHNRKPSEFTEKVEKLGLPDAPPFFPSLVLFLVKDWDTDYSLSVEGAAEMEDERPGILASIVQGFHEARKVKLQGN